MQVKHFRLETEKKLYLIALIPINFGRLWDPQKIEAGLSSEGNYMLAIDDDAYIEADPYSWIIKDFDLVCAHFYLRENASHLRGGQVLKSSEIRKEVQPRIDHLLNERKKNEVPVL